MFLKVIYVSCLSSKKLPVHILCSGLQTAVVLGAKKMGRCKTKESRGIVWGEDDFVLGQKWAHIKNSS